VASGRRVGRLLTRTTNDASLSRGLRRIPCTHSCGCLPWDASDGEGFTDTFRRIVKARYLLLPYVYAQARLCSERGHPMLGALFFECPEDPASWTVEDE
jgi:hypothetical protein